MDKETIVNDDPTIDISGLYTDDLADLIKKARQELHMSQRKFAELVDVTQAQLSRLENGSSVKPNKKTIRALAPYIKNKTYPQLLAYAGYTVVDDDWEKINIANEPESVFNQFGGLPPETKKMIAEIMKFLNDPKNSLLLQKVVNLMEMIYEKKGDYEEQLKMITLRECVINMIQ